MRNSWLTFLWIAATWTWPSHALIITEVYTDVNVGTNAGCGGYTYFQSNQFVEIYNETAGAIDIGGYKIRPHPS